jgi:hypothetical protein
VSESKGLGLGKENSMVLSYEIPVWLLSLPGGVIGNTREFGSRFPGSSPGWAASLRSFGFLDNEDCCPA